MSKGKFPASLCVLLRLRRVGRLMLTGLLLGMQVYCHAQTNISGIVNSYYQVLSVVPAKACVVLNTTAGLSPGDRAMLVQMKGAGINTSSSTSSSFGDTTSLNNAGNYELGEICYIRADSVFFVYMLLNPYTAGSGVQLVRVPEYYQATVVDTLKAMPWNSATGTGGVIAIYVDEDLVLNAPVFADTSGYSGGAYKVSNSTCSDFAAATAYAYNANTLTPQNGGFKGEGVADVAAAQSGGRGAPANGGGGGNNHNNGGGGGANLSSGGNGGGNSSSTGCTTVLQGRGGKALSSYGGTKIFMGGGGGAGHVNNGAPVPKGGGDGGGIIFIRANTLTGNGYKITAAGQTGGATTSDGASGGGAGGTIILSVSTFSGTTIINANGGQGGTEDDGLNINHCYGAGGGGSGGAVYFSGAVPGAPVTVSVNGGNAGPEVNHDASCVAAVPSVAGSAGQVVANYTYRRSGVLTNNYCSALLPVAILSFSARLQNGQVMLDWEVAQPESIDHFVIEKSSDGNAWTGMRQVAGTVLSSYSTIDAAPFPGANYYRIRIATKTNNTVYSVIRKIFIDGRNDRIAIYPNPASDIITITGVTAPGELLLMDAGGRICWRKMILATQRSIELGLPRLPPGVYMVQFAGTTKKLVIY